MSQTIETTAAEAARLAAFPVMTPGQSVVGRRLEMSLFLSDPRGRSPEQFIQVYEGGVQFRMSHFVDGAPLSRAGGTTVTTPLGAGHLFPGGSTVELIVLNGNVALAVSAPDKDIAQLVLRSLRPVAR